MQLNPTMTVQKLAIELPGATRVFEELNIDYCCRGNQSIGEACAHAGLTLDAICGLLDGAAVASPTDHDDEPPESLMPTALSAYIINKHHSFTRSALQRITFLLEKVCSAHGANHPELLQIQSEFHTLRGELGPHMMKEENILFPYIARLEAAVIETGPAPRAHFGSVRNPVAAMMKEHEVAGEILREIRKLSGGFVTPTDGCASYRTLYEALREFEADLHQHIHLENNLLFPKAVELEAI